METDLKKAVGQRLQMLRLQKSLTQEQMGEKLNLSTSAYCKIEYGETDLTLVRLYKIAEILNYPILELFSKITANGASKYSDHVNACTTKDYSANYRENAESLRELIKANTRIIDLLCKRLDALEDKTSSL